MRLMDVYTTVLVLYMGGEFEMSGISGGARCLRGEGFQLRGISGGARLVRGKAI